MALVITTAVGTTNYLERTSGILPVASGDATVFMWVRANVNTPTAGRYRTFHTLIDSGAYNDYGGFFSRLAGVDAQLSIGLGGVFQGSSTFGTVALSQYRALTWTHNATTHQHKFYLGVPGTTSTLTLIATFTSNISAAAFANDFIGTDGTADSWGNLNVQCMRQWTACLTQAEIEAEMRSMRAYRSANLWLDCPLQTDALDVSGNGRDYTTVTDGSLSYQTTDTLIALSPASFLDVTSLPDSEPVTAAAFNAGTYADAANEAWARVSGVTGYVGVQIDTPGVAYTMQVYREGVGLELFESASSHTLPDGYVTWTAEPGVVYWVRVKRSTAAPADFTVNFVAAAPSWTYDQDITSFPYSFSISSAAFNAAKEYRFRYVATGPCVVGAFASDLNSGAFFTNLYLVSAEHKGVVAANIHAGNVQIPAAGEYYFHVRSSAYDTGSASANQSTSFSAEKFDAFDTIPANSVVINNDTGGMWATAWDKTTGALIGFVTTVVAGEHGSALPDGTSLWFEQHASSDLAVLDPDLVNGPQLVLLDSTGVFVSGFQLTPPIVDDFDACVITNDDDHFYVGNFADNKIYKVTRAGSVSLFADVSSIGWSTFVLSADSSKIYLLYQFDATLKTWDVASDTLESTVTIAPLNADFSRMATVPEPLIGEALVMADGSMVTQYLEASGETHLLHFQADGTVLHDYLMPSTDNINHIHYDPDDRADSVLVWYFIDPDETQVDRVQLSTGTRTNLVPATPTWTFGVMERQSTSTPLAGITGSCTILTASGYPTVSASEPGPGDDDDIPDNQSTPECCQAGGGGGGDTGENPNPVGTLPPWTRSCTGGGAVDSVADLADGEDWTQPGLHPTAIVQVDITPTEGDPIRWRASVRPYADSDGYGGLTKGGILEFAEAVRSLSDRSGSPVVSTFSFVTFDRDGFWRGLQAGSTTRYLTSQDITYLLESVGAHTSEVAGRTLFRGQLREPAPQPGRRYKVDGESRVGTRRGPIDLDSPVAKRKYETADLPNLPREIEGKCIAGLHGELSDFGTVNAAGVDISQGMANPVACGAEFQGSTPGTPPTSPTYALPPTNLRVSFSDAGGTRIKATIGVSFIVAGGGETTVTTLQVPNYMKSPNVFFGGTHEVYWDWDDPNAAGIVRKARMWFSEGYIDLPIHNLDQNVSPDADSAQTSYTDDGDDSHTKLLYGPPPKTNTAQIAPGTPGTAGNSFFYVWFNWLWHLGKITNLYASNLAEGTAALVPVPAADIGDDWTSGKPFLMGPSGTGVLRTINGKSFFGYWGKKGDGRVEAHLSNTMAMRLNGCGFHQADNTALPIVDQAGRVALDVLVQYSGDQAGPRVTIPSFASWPTIPVLQSTTYEATQDVTKRYLGNSKGYEATVYIDSFDLKWRDFFAKANRTFRFDSGENHHGQHLLATMDDEQDPTDGLLLQERIDIVRVNDAGALVDNEVYTVVRYQFDKHPIDGKFRSGVLELRASEDAIDAYGERVLTLDMDYTRDPDTARDAATRWLVDSAAGPSYVEIVTRLRRGITVELGQSYRVQHSDLITDTPRPMYLRLQGVDTQKGEVRLRGRDRTGLFALQSAPDDTDGTDYDDATASERLLYAFASDDDGLLPDGSLGSRAR